MPHSTSTKDSKDKSVPALRRDKKQDRFRAKLLGYFDGVGGDCRKYTVKEVLRVIGEEDSRYSRTLLTKLMNEEFSQDYMPTYRTTNRAWNLPKPRGRQEAERLADLFLGRGELQEKTVVELEEEAHMLRMQNKAPDAMWVLLKTEVLYNRAMEANNFSLARQCLQMVGQNKLVGAFDMQTGPNVFVGGGGCEIKVEFISPGQAPQEKEVKGSAERADGDK